MTRTALYRHHDADDALLYVGVSSHPGARLAAHERSAVWFGLVAKTTYQWFETREEAIVAEGNAIANEKPERNRVRSGKNLGHVSEAGAILQGVGAKDAAAQLGVSYRSVTNAAYSDRLPASWYATLCEMAGRDLPRDVFTFKRAESA